ncbi:MAG: hypothetical protein MN733_16810 [Nitrososphaera sp.]|nr:hypothetical protein [Nitrososphaera sp.]
MTHTIYFILESFLKEYETLVKRAYVVALDGKKEKLTDKITRIPWHML